MLFSTCLHCKNAIAVYSRCEAGQRVFPRLVFCHEGITSKWHFPFHQVSIFFSIRFSPWLRFCVITSGIATFTGRQSLTFLQRCVTQLLLSPSIAKKLKKKRGRCFLEKYSEQIVIGKKKRHPHTHTHTYTFLRISRASPLGTLQTTVKSCHRERTLIAVIESSCTFFYNLSILFQQSISVFPFLIQIQLHSS